MQGVWVKVDVVAGSPDGRILCAHERGAGNAATGVSA
jgi:hypothetical protein